MFPFLDPLQPTAVPALFFLVWLPVFLWLRPQHARAFFIIAGTATLVFVAGPPLALGLWLIILAGYGLIEGVARLRRRLIAGLLLLVALHAGYWACFHLLLPGGYASLHQNFAPGVYILFSGIGLTFFRLIGYFWDRVRTQAPPLSFLDYLAYMLFFPQFRHGPIERAHAFTRQLAAARQRATPTDLRYGLLRILIGVAAIVGLFQGLRLAFPDVYRHNPWRLLSELFANPQNLSFPQLLLLIHLPTLAAYVFESSSAHLQLGISRVFGVRGSENFNFPILATNPAAVWSRWNITLSRWLRDYVYLPLSHNRRWRYASIVLVFVYCGLLHGLQLNFLIWGAWTGCTLALYRWITRRRTSTPRPPRHWLLRACTTTLARLATFHWFCIGATIFIDAQYCGVRVLSDYLHRLFGWLLA
jgi:D-alanyl-lipoteichoic acid acyltransferase DltB (MBOAT superfamily)